MKNKSYFDIQASIPTLIAFITITKLSWQPKQYINVKQIPFHIKIQARKLSYYNTRNLWLQKYLPKNIYD